MLFEFVGGARGGIETKGRSAAQYDGVHLINGVLRFEAGPFRAMPARPRARRRRRRRPSGATIAVQPVPPVAVREVPEPESGNLGD
ncbi:MAG: hypothetical protein ACLTSX_01835 [Collinsella sp.]